MATTGKIPFIGFKAGAVKFLTLLGFTPGAAANPILARVTSVTRLSSTRTLTTLQASRTVTGIP